MRFQEYDLVKINHNMPAKRLHTGAVGTVLMAHPANPPAYEVEFLDDEGNTVALLTLNENELDAVK